MQSLRRTKSVLLVNTALLVLITGSSACHSSKNSSVKRLPGIWQSTPIVVDGKNNDWPSPYPEYDDKAMLGYMVTNDKNNLYITVETGDPATQLKILREGLTVWIDRKGEKEEVTAINYPIPIRRDNEDGSSDDRPARQHAQGQSGHQNTQQQRQALENKVAAALDQAKEYSLQGFKNCNLQFPILEIDTCGVYARIAIDTDNELIWEAVIPFRSFYFKPEISRADKGRPISICIETTGEERPAGDQGNGGHGGGMRPSMGFGMGMGMGMGMSMGGGGGRRGNGNNQQNSIMESLYKSTKTYKKFGIAFQ